MVPAITQNPNGITRGSCKRLQTRAFCFFSYLWEERWAAVFWGRGKAMGSKDPVMHGVAIRRVREPWLKQSTELSCGLWKRGPEVRNMLRWALFKQPVVKCGATGTTEEHQMWAWRRPQLPGEWWTEIQTGWVPSLEIPRSVLSERNHEKSIRGVLSMHVCIKGSGYQTCKIQLDVYDLHL